MVKIEDFLKIRTDDGLLKLNMDTAKYAMSLNLQPIDLYYSGIHLFTFFYYCGCHSVNSLKGQEEYFIQVKKLLKKYSFDEKFFERLSTVHAFFTHRDDIRTIESKIKYLKEINFSYGNLGNDDGCDIIIGFDYESFNKLK